MSRCRDGRHGLAGSSESAVRSQPTAYAAQGDQVPRLEAGVGPALGALASASGARTALDLFTGSTRVAQEFKRRGIHTTAADIATYSAVLAQCFIATDARTVDRTRLAEVLDHLNTLPGRPGYVTATFCEQARYFQPHNGARIDAIRNELAQHFVADPLLPILLTSLLLAADRVDSTAGMQQAYLKSWSRRSYNALELREPELLSGTGESVLGDAGDVVEAMEAVDLAYLDPPYNQHRYFTNYHIWETLIRWDSPSTMASPANGSTPAIPPPRASSTRSARCRRRSPICCGAPRRKPSSFPTTTKPGSHRSRC